MAARIPLHLLIRDLLLIAATLGLWAWSRQLDLSGGTLAIAVAVAAGTMTAVCGYLIHEWGHLTGALLRGSVVELPHSVRAVFLFKFNSEVNSRKQFLWMSLGGFIASALVVALLFALLSPQRLADQVALGLTVAGVAATLILEVPPALKVYRGAELPRGVAYSGAPATPQGGPQAPTR